MIKFREAPMICRGCKHFIVLDGVYSCSKIKCFMCADGICEYKRIEDCFVENWTICPVKEENEITE